MYGVSNENEGQDWKDVRLRMVSAREGKRGAVGRKQMKVLAKITSRLIPTTNSGIAFSAITTKLMPVSRRVPQRLAV